jgi:hypothetical protein
MSDEESHCALVIVNVESHGAAFQTVLGTLEKLGIPADIVGHGRQLRRAPSVVFRVPQVRAADAIIALEASGFADVLAYCLEQPEE